MPPASGLAQIPSVLAACPTDRCCLPVPVVRLCELKLWAGRGGPKAEKKMEHGTT